MTDPRVIHGDMREVLGRMAAEGKLVQSIVTDPPYHLTNNTGSRSPLPGQYTPIGKPKEPKGGFMGKAWDGGDVAFQPGTWRLCFDLLPPGGHLLAFAGTRTFHRLAVAIEEAGFEIRDTIAWLYGSGFPKSHNVSKGIDKAAGAEREAVGGYMHRGSRSGGIMGGDAGRVWHDITAPATDAARQWDGWGTALKPAMELICVARKPLDGTVAATVLKHGTGALNIDGCRVGIDASERETIDNRSGAGFGTGNTVGGSQGRADGVFTSHNLGRWPANVCHDGSDEVVKVFPAESSVTGARSDRSRNASVNGTNWLSDNHKSVEHIDSGSPARFFYSSKADADDRLGSKHPTVKPVDLMRWLVRLITPPGGTVLDPFAGSGTTGMACMAEGIDCILIEREAEYVADIKARIAHVRGDDTPLFAVAAE